ALGIREFPTPAGGCRLTDPCLAGRVRRYFERTPRPERTPADVRLLLVGRPFCLPGGSLFTLGRDEAENAAVAALAQPGDELAAAVDVPGPVGLLRPRQSTDRAAAASVLLRYAKKAGPGTRVGFGPDPDRPERELEPAPATDETLASWRA
ncbi:MAG: thiamine biosynthesis protein, partial [Deltaproteobacteria bacterium]|nr:thiamine biosynthesis protein [Deltaproteobacteria bacterium]